MKNIKLSRILFYSAAVLSTFSIFMFFMSALKWVDSDLIKSLDLSNPSFFDLMFGIKNSLSQTWPIVIGLLFLFFIQSLLTIFSLVIIFMSFFKKIYFERAIRYAIPLALIAIVCALLCFLTATMSSSKSIIIYSYGDIDVGFKLAENVKMTFGCYIYGITMIIACLSAVVSYITYKLDK